MPIGFAYNLSKDLHSFKFANHAVGAAELCLNQLWLSSPLFRQTYFTYYALSTPAAIFPPVGVEEALYKPSL